MAVLGWYIGHHDAIIDAAWVSQQWAVLAIFGVILLAFLLQFGIVMFLGKWLKVRAVIMGLMLLMLSHYTLIDNAQVGIYAGDMMSVIALLMIFLALAGWIVTKKVEQKIQEGRQVIIEV
jgi:hypothetical protein